MHLKKMVYDRTYTIVRWQKDAIAKRQKMDRKWMAEGPIILRSLHIRKYPSKEV